MRKCFRIRWRSFLSGLLAGVLLASALAVLPDVRPASALDLNAVQEIATQMSNVFNWLAWDQAGSAAVAQAKTNLENLGQAGVQNVLWPSTPPSGGYILPLPTGSSTVTPAAASQLLLDFTSLGLSGPSGFLNNPGNLSNLLTNLPADESVVETLLPGVSLQDLYDFFYDAQSIGLSQQSASAATLESILESSGGVNNVLTSSALQNVLSGAMQYVGTHTGNGINSSDGTVYTKLTAVGWTVSRLVQAELEPGLFNLLSRHPRSSP